MQLQWSRDPEIAVNRCATNSVLNSGRLQWSRDPEIAVTCLDTSSGLTNRTLQWSRDPEIAVTSQHVPWARGQASASMEPRSGDRGD